MTVTICCKDLSSWTKRGHQCVLDWFLVPSLRNPNPGEIRFLAVGPADLHLQPQLSRFLDSRYFTSSCFCIPIRMFRVIKHGLAFGKCQIIPSSLF